MRYTLCKKISLVVFGLMLTLGSFISSQEVLTASQYFDNIYQKYQDLEDLTATVTFSMGNTTSSGSLLFKAPSSFKLEFNDRRVFLKTVDKLTVYSPNLNMTFVQNLKPQRVNSNPFSIIRSEYSVSYATSPNFEPLEEGSSEMVKKLIFRRRSLRGATISQLEIAFNRDSLMRRVIAVTNSGRTLVLDFSNVLLNSGVFETQLNYTPPHGADIVNNFLYDEV